MQIMSCISYFKASITYAHVIYVYTEILRFKPNAMDMRPPTQCMPFSPYLTLSIPHSPYAPPDPTPAYHKALSLVPP